MVNINFTQALKMAMKSVKSNKMRSFLTMLGIIIGVGAIIALVSVVQGATGQITDQLASMGTSMVTVNITGQGTTRTANMRNMTELVEDNPDVIRGVAPQNGGRAMVRAGANNSNVNIIGTNPVFASARNITTEAGRFINDEDVELRRNNAVIGTFNAFELFGGANPIGENIRINGVLFTVVGVLEERGGGRQGSDDDRIIIPYTAAISLFNNGTIGMFIVEATSPEMVDTAIALTESFLTRHFGTSDAFHIFNMQNIVDMANEMTGMMAILLGGIAGISLLVGGIGIMNIMLVSVTERTREIGIRKAIGARRSSILTQFLIESIVVSCMGGIVGIVLGSLGAIGIGRIMEANMGSAVNTTPQLGIILFSFGFAAFIGIFFGLYPANKASKLNPIEALRFD